MKKWTSVLLAAILVPTLKSQAPLFTNSSVAVGTGSGQIILTDLNGDGRIDMMTRHLLEHSVRTFWGDGRGGFSPAPAAGVDLPYAPGKIVVADFNRDRRPDLAVSRSDVDAVDVFLGDGNTDLVAATSDSVTVLLAAGRTFRPAPGSPYRAGPGAYKVTVGDINADGKPDIAASAFEGTMITLLLSTK